MTLGHLIMNPISRRVFWGSIFLILGYLDLVFIVVIGSGCSSRTGAPPPAGSFCAIFENFYVNVIGVILFFAFPVLIVTGMVCYISAFRVKFRMKRHA